MLEKLLLALFHGKNLAVAGTLTTALVVTGTAAVQVLAAYPDDPLTEVEAPTLGAPLSGTVTISGWSIDRNVTDEEDGAGVESVTLYLNDLETPLGEATLGLETPDVAELLGDQFANAGWRFDWDTTELSTGNHTLIVVALSRVSGATSHVVREVNDPLLRIEAPEPGTVVEEAIELRGWAIDRYEPDGPGTGPGTGILRVEVYRDGSEVLTELLGEATLGDPTPEVAAVHGGRFASAGWHFTWVPGDVEPGTYVLRVIAFSAVSDRTMEATVEVVVPEPPEEPEEDAKSCGELIGAKRGQTIQKLQSEWLQRHLAVMAYASRMGTIGVDMKTTFIGRVQAARADVQQIRHEALMAIHDKAAEVKAACQAGGPTEALVAEYDEIVEEAAALMDEVVALATAELEEIAASSTWTPGPPPGAGPPAGAGRPGGAGRP